MKTSPPELIEDDFDNALKELNASFDVTLQDLLQINQIALKHARLREVGEFRLGDIMSREIVSVTPRTPLRDAARKLLELRISGLPVTDDDGHLAGIVTEADFLTAMGVPCHHPSQNLWQTLQSMFRQRPTLASLPERVEDIMSRDVIAMQAAHSLHDAIEHMNQHHIKRVVVIDDDRHVTGMITRSDLVKVLLEQLL